jgi:regulator of sigma E protease
MLNTLITILAFLLVIGILIGVHEFGHYWVARRLGVKVVKFSIGFGRALASKRLGRDQTEYVIAALPIGGYVKMLDEREGEVAPEDRHRAFNRQPLYKRVLILFAGPAFNLLLAAFCYWLVFIGGVPGLKPVVGAVTPQSPAALAGVKAGDEILAVNGTSTPTWQTANLRLLDGVMGGGRLNLEVRQPDRPSRTVSVRAGNAERLTEPGALLPGLGLDPWRPPAVIGRVVDGSPAARSGLGAGDTIVAAGGHPISTWADFVRFVRARPKQAIPVTVMRGGHRHSLSLAIGSKAVNGKAIGHIGAARAPVPEKLRKKMTAVQQFGPAAALVHGVGKTASVSWLTIRMLWGMVTGQISLKNLSGPVSIARYAGSAVNAGGIAFATYLAIISISLGVLNLLPIPVLDGGQLLFCGIEWVKGAPMSMRAQLIGQQIGITLLLALMGFAVFNDLTRLAG